MRADDAMLPSQGGGAASRAAEADVDRRDSGGRDRRGDRCGCEGWNRGRRRRRESFGVEEGKAADRGSGGRSTATVTDGYCRSGVVQQRARSEGTRGGAMADSTLRCWCCGLGWRVLLGQEGVR